MAAFNDAVKAAKQLSSDVAVTEIPPRSQPPHAKDNIAALNANIVAAAAELSIAYVSNQNYFLLQSNDINDGYFYDHVHLTIKGSDKLAAAMGLKSKSSESFSSLRPQQTAPQTRPRPYPRPRPRPAQRSQRTGVPARGTQRRGTNPNPVPSARGTQQMSTGSSQSTEDTATLMSAAFWRRAREKAMVGHGNRHNDTKRFSPGPNEVSKSYNNDYCEKCGEANHLTMSCFHKQAIKCHDCHMVGHKSKLCKYYHWRGARVWQKFWQHKILMLVFL